MGLKFNPVTANLDLDTTGGGGSAHVIQEDGTPLTNRANLNFRGFELSDDSGGDSTIVDLPIQLEEYRTGQGSDLQGFGVRLTTGTVIRSITASDSLSVTNEDGTAGNPTVVLEGDTASPGNNMVYGTDGAGTKGWQTAGSGLTQAQVLSMLSIGF